MFQNIRLKGSSSLRNASEIISGVQKSALYILEKSCLERKVWCIE